MIKLLQLNKLISYILFFLILIFYSNISYAAEDIWKKEEKNKIEIKQDDNLELESTITLEDNNNEKLLINEEEIENFEQSLIGIFDPEKNNFNLEMWTQSDGLDIKKILSPNWILKSIIFPARTGPVRLEISNIIIKDAFAAINLSPL